MRSLLALNHRRRILECLPHGGRMLEWGSGGSTLWFLHHLAPDQHLTTVEHAGGWASSVRQAAGDAANWTLLERPSLLPVGKNATQWEECPAGLAGYIQPLASRELLAGFDVFLVDGVARGACLAAILLNAKPGAKAFLHDVERAVPDRAGWYDWITTCSGRIGRVIPADAGEYPPSLLELEV